MKKNKGITLIALIITIIIMLILVAVSVSILINSGLIGKAKEAGEKTKTSYSQEQSLGDSINIDGVVYSFDEYLDSLTTNDNINWEQVIATAQKHPDQQDSADIGVGTDGNPVNLDLWNYEIINGNEISIGAIDDFPAYKNQNIVDGRIQGTVPQYIKVNGEDAFYPVTDMGGTFYTCFDLIEAPNIPSTVTNMANTFNFCSSLLEAPQIPSGVTNLQSTFCECYSLITPPSIPNGVTDMNSTFSLCNNLTVAPTIPSSVTDMRNTFSGCESLITAPIIPSRVTNMYGTFYSCNSLTGDLVINANPTDIDTCLGGAATNAGCDLKLSGTSTKLNEILATKSSNSHISLK